MGVDRYLALKYTYAYANTVTRKRALLVIASLWTISVLWALLGIPQWSDVTLPFPPETNIQKVSIYNTKKTGCGTYDPEYFKVTLVLWILLPIVLLVFVYTYIYRTALRHVNEISRLHVGDAVQIRRKKQFQLTRSIVAVFVAYCSCWGPYCVIMLWSMTNIPTARRLYCSGDTGFKVISILCSKLTVTVCPIVNPFIYVLTNAAFVTALQRLFRSVTGLEWGRKDDSIIGSEVTKTDDTFQMRECSGKSGTSSAKYVATDGVVNKGIDIDET